MSLTSGFKVTEAFVTNGYGEQTVDGHGRSSSSAFIIEFS
jgi:hypothetical protein